ncbi:hypothetical protein HKX48_008627 [Thoreauomyces humboldtii]|nr:hypothetical protein HKX48_008627 [Thoreauomyces humboldtii]
MPRLFHSQTTLMQLTRMLDQLSNTSLSTHNLVSTLVTQSLLTTTRISDVRSRIQSLKDATPQLEDKLLDAQLADSIGQEKFDWKSRPMVASNLFTRDSEDPLMREAYDACHEAPRLSEMDEYRTDSVPCMKLYSYPEFFAEEWRTLMQKEIDEERRRKRERRELKKKAKLARPATLNKIQVQELQIKRYNSQGEVITDPDVLLRSSTSTEPRLRPVSVALNNRPWDMTQQASQSSLRNSVALSSWEDQNPSPNTINRRAPSPLSNVGLQRQESMREQALRRTATMNSGGSGGGGTSAVAAAAPPPPPPPPPPPAPGPGLPSASALAGGIAALRGEGARVTVNQIPVVAEKKSFLDDVKGGQFTLRKVDRPVLTEKQQRNKRAEGSDVAAILMRRAAIEMSDSENEDSGEDDEWA